MSILVITTGRTIGAMPYKDLKHPSRIVTMPGKGQDFVRTALQKISHTKTRCISHETRDSNTIDDMYRQGILDIIKNAPETMIVITHGTDGLLATADYFYRQFSLDAALKKKTLILTGAMVPLSCGEQSEGMANLSFTLKQLSNGLLQNGVYIVLSDYQDESSRMGWAPRLYFYKPGAYEKYYDPDDARRNRLKRIDS
jgi:L-asparaginase